MNDNTTKLIGIKDLIVKKVDTKPDCYEIDVELPRREHICPVCGHKTDKIHDYRNQKIKDISAFGKPVYLHLRKRRYVCKSCGKRFYEHNEFLPKYHRLTRRAVAKIIDDFRDTVSAAYIAKKSNISPSTAWRYFDNVNYGCKKLPTVLSIDEFKGDADKEKYQTIITDAENKEIIDILPNRKKRDLVKYFRKFENRKDVKYVVIDMNKHFLDVAETCFPNAKIVIDKYHVSRQVGWALENVRKAEQKKLSAPWRKFCKNTKYLLLTPKDKLKNKQLEKLRIILGLSTNIEIAYDLKNDFMEFMYSPNSEIAKERLSTWIYHAENAKIPEFEACIKAMHNWSKYILNAFDVPYTNGYTEGCNNKTKVIKRVSYGIHRFSHLRNRILHCRS